MITNPLLLLNYTLYEYEYLINLVWELLLAKCKMRFSLLNLKYLSVGLPIQDLLIQAYCTLWEDSLQPVSALQFFIQVISFRLLTFEAFESKIYFLFPKF